MTIVTLLLGKQKVCVYKGESVCVCVCLYISVCTVKAVNSKELYKVL